VFVCYDCYIVYSFIGSHYIEGNGLMQSKPVKEEED